jgi:hypothetical protein
MSVPSSLPAAAISLRRAFETASAANDDGLDDLDSMAELAWAQRRKVTNRSGASSRENWSAHRAETTVCGDERTGDTLVSHSTPSPTPSLTPPAPYTATASSPARTLKEVVEEIAARRRPKPTFTALSLGSAPWRNLTGADKLAHLFRSVSASGEALSISINFGGDVARAANDNPNRFRKLFHDRFVKLLASSTLGPRDHVLAYDLSDDGRLHIHGAVAGTMTEKATWQPLLRAAGGKWDRPGSSQFQVKVKPLSANGWAGYIFRRERTARQVEKLLGARVGYTCSREVTQRAKADWDQQRLRLSS